MDDFIDCLIEMLTTLGERHIVNETLVCNTIELNPKHLVTRAMNLLPIAYKHLISTSEQSDSSFPSHKRTMAVDYNNRVTYCSCPSFPGNWVPQGVYPYLQGIYLYLQGFYPGLTTRGLPSLSRGLPLPNYVFRQVPPQGVLSEAVSVSATQ